MRSVRNFHQNLLVFYKTECEKYLLTNPLFNISPNYKVLTWYNYMNKQSFYNYEDYYQWIANNLQYSLVVNDKVFIQIYYMENADSVITNASLSFIPHPDLLMTYFRFDMDILNKEDFYHNSYHINFGYNSSDIRFSLNRFPYPVEFVKFCLFLMGSDEFKKFDRDNFFENLFSLGEGYSHIFDFTLD